MRCNRIEFVWAERRETPCSWQKDNFNPMKDDSRNLVELVEHFLKILERTDKAKKLTATLYKKNALWWWSGGVDCSTADCLKTQQKVSSDCWSVFDVSWLPAHAQPEESNTEQQWKWILNEQLIVFCVFYSVFLSLSLWKLPVNYLSLPVKYEPTFCRISALPVDCASCRLRFHVIYCFSLIRSITDDVM